MYFKSPSADGHCLCVTCLSTTSSKEYNYVNTYKMNEALLLLSTEYVHKPLIRD